MKAVRRIDATEGKSRVCGKNEWRASMFREAKASFIKSA